MTMQTSEERSRGKRAWQLLTVHVACDAEELANAVLFDLGATGTVTLEEAGESLKLGAYFEESEDAAALAQEIDSEFALAGQRQSLLGITVSEVADQDWMQKWKEGFEPLSVGRRLIVAPSWKLPTDAAGRNVIQIDPGQAFGTGTHETTRLCLEALETYWRGGNLLDVGTGTGILAIAAALLEKDTRVTAVDIDPLAVEVARENVAVNKVEGAIEVFEGQPADYAGRGFDAVVANLTAEVIVAVMRELAACLKAEGVMILSGILTPLGDDVARAAEEAGLMVIERREAGEWLLVVARKGGA